MPKIENLINNAEKIKQNKLNSPKPATSPVVQSKKDEAKSIFDVKPKATEKTSENEEYFGIFQKELSEVGNVSYQDVSAVPTPLIKPKYHNNGTKDGEIGNTKQRGTGDCWLLSAVNALSYTEAGKEVIKNALEYHGDCTIVHTTFGDYTVTNDEIAVVRSAINNLWYQQYSTGDDDMLIFELATEKVLDDIACGNITPPEEANWLVKELECGYITPTENGKSSADGGSVDTVWYLLTGKIGDRVPYMFDEESYQEGNENLDKFQQNENKNLVMCANTDDILPENGKHYDTIKDIHGKKFKIAGGHSYAIKKVTDDTVTVINPWDSSKEMVLPRKQFLHIFRDLRILDLSENNTTEK